MDDTDDSDSEVEVSRKRKLNILEEDSDESDDDDESESDGEDESDDSVDNPDDDVALPDDTNNDQCAICLMEFTDQKVGVPNNCTHVFCLVCIQEWAKNINTCPVDRKVFHTISVKKAKNGVTIEEIRVEDRTQVKEEEYEDPTTCEICGIGDREDRMLLCDRCDRGFHLECLTPPLDSVPDEEWFCRDCFIDHTDNTQEHDTVDYSQHAIAFSDDELPTFELQPRSTASSSMSSNSRTSTSQQRRARTVATSRERRQQRTAQTRRPTGRQRSKKKKSKKAKSSSKGASTTATRTSKARRRKKRKKSTKKKMKKDNENSHQNTARYLLPREVEPTATFSLFGSDFDLEYLPVIERPAAPVSKKSSPPRSSTHSDPDVLGSIFTGLNTLHSASLSVDNKGRVKSEDNNPANQSSISKSNTNIPTTSTQTTSLSGVGLNTCCPREISGKQSIHGNVHKQSTSSKRENCNENESTSRKLINGKRLVRFNTSTSEPTIAKLKVDSSSFADNRNIARKFDPEKKTKLLCKGNKSSTSFLASAASSCDVSETALKASQPSLVSFKIPKKSSASASNLTPPVSKSTKLFGGKSASKPKLPIKSPVNISQSKIARRKFKAPNVPKESSGILHLLPAEVGRSRKKQTVNGGGGNTSNENVRNYSSQTSVTHSTASNTLGVSKTIDKKCSESASNILNSRSPLNPGANLPYVNKASTFRHSTSRHTSGHDNFSSYVNGDNSSLDLTSKASSQTVRNVEPCRPVAVVRPTKIDDGQDTSSLETEVAKRRKEGIERLQRREAICEEVKKALKPFYKYKEISKESYKYIFSRAAEKISKSPLPVVSRDVASLVRNYVKKLKGRQSQPTLYKN